MNPTGQNVYTPLWKGETPSKLVLSATLSSESSIVERDDWMLSLIILGNIAKEMLAHNSCKEYDSGQIKKQHNKNNQDYYLNSAFGHHP